MSKSKKKRNKPYRGEDAAVVSNGPTVHRYIAEHRNPRQEWWRDNKRRITLGAKIGGVTVIVAWLIFEAIRLVV